MRFNKNITKLATASILLAGTSSLHAAPVQVTYDFTNGGTTSNANVSGFGNSLLFSDIDNDNASTENLTATAWGSTGPKRVSSPWGNTLETGEIWRWNTGLGACNRTEGTIGGGCSTFQHQVDNRSYDDFVLFAFDNTMTFDNVVIDPYFRTDVDVTFWIGNITNTDLTGQDDVTLLNMGFNNPIDTLFNGKTYSPQTIDLFGGTGNVLLISGQRDIGAPDDDDYFKIASLTVTTTVVPVPAAVWLFGSGLIGLIGVARRKSAS